MSRAWGRLDGKNERVPEAVAGRMAGPLGVVTLPPETANKPEGTPTRPPLACEAMLSPAMSDD